MILVLISAPTSPNPLACFGPWLNGSKFDAETIGAMSSIGPRLTGATDLWTPNPVETPRESCPVNLFAGHAGFLNGRVSQYLPHYLDATAAAQLEKDLVAPFMPHLCSKTRAGARHG